MKDDGLILTAWAEAVRQQIPAVLATVVKVSGSSYRSPGARMLITENGGRTGSISGGCLEGDVLKKAWWLTGEHRAALRVYDNTSDDDAVWAFGLGCNGVVEVLLERWSVGSQPLEIEILRACREARQDGVLATIISGPQTGQKAAVLPHGTARSDIADPACAGFVLDRARESLERRESRIITHDDCSKCFEVFVEYIAPPVALLIVGAGQDALPVVRFAKELGWHVTVADGHSNQARPERFPQADHVVVVDPHEPLGSLHIDEQTVAVLMSHSYPQDAAFLRALLDRQVRYLGVLGPRKRTDRMLAEAGLPNAIENAGELHSPVGLDIGADTPEEIALAIVSEIQAALNGRPGGMLRARSGPIHEARRNSPLSSYQPA